MIPGSTIADYGTIRQVKKDKRAKAVYRAALTLDETRNLLRKLLGRYMS
jgi:hypothetical protein